jgi:hypothetical protein
MNEQPSGPPDLRMQAASLRHGGLSGRRKSTRYYVAAYRIYFGLLLFVVLAGLPITGVPSLRHRLASRVQTLREAWSSSGRSAAPPVVARVGENTEAFPKEYEIPLQTWGKGAGMLEMRMPVFRAGGQPGAQQEAPKTPAEETSEPAEPGTGEVAVTYQQGDAERVAYQALLKANQTMSDMVQGKDPSLRFVRWAAARREEDTYWVDLTFKSSSDGTEAHYIWQVTVTSGSVTPLSARARAITGQ